MLTGVVLCPNQFISNKLYFDVSYNYFVGAVGVCHVVVLVGAYQTSVS